MACEVQFQVIVALLRLHFCHLSALFALHLLELPHVQYLFGLGLYRARELSPWLVVFNRVF